MTVQILSLSALFTLAGLVLHICWWRRKHPLDDAATLLLVMGALPFAATLSCTFIGIHSPTANPADTGIALWLNLIVPLALLHVLMALGYMSCYTAAQAASPTVLIILACLSHKGPATRPQIAGMLDDDLVCGDLIQAAMNQKFILERDGRLHLAPRGRILLSVGRSLRKFLGLPAPTG